MAFDFGDMLTAMGASMLMNDASASTQYHYNSALTKDQHNYNMKAMKQAQKYSKELSEFNQKLTLQNLNKSPGALREGMENAGFNPILAYSNGSFTNATSPGSSQALGVGLASSSMPDIAGGTASVYQSGLQARQQRNQDKLTLAQVNNTNADSQLKAAAEQTELAKQANYAASTALTNIDKQLQQKNIDWYDRQQLREQQKVIIENQKANALDLQAISALRNSETNASKLDIDRYNAQTMRYNAYTGRYEAQTGRLNYGVNAKNASTNAYNAYTKRHTKTYSASSKGGPFGLSFSQTKFFGK